MGTTDVIDSMNMLIAPSSDSGASTYRGGKNYGVLFRSEDGFSDLDYHVVPSSLIHNDLVAPSSTYTCGDPHCIRTTGFDGVYKQDICTYDTYMNAALGWAIGDEGSLRNILYDLDNIQTDKWGWGVFYVTDANAADGWCEYRDDWNPPGWDCPKFFVEDDGLGTTIADDGKRGAGYYDAGSPQTNIGGGGGAGCHFGNDSGNNWINQWNALDSNGVNLVRNKECECEYDFKGGDYPWKDWVDVFINGDDRSRQRALLSAQQVAEWSVPRQCAGRNRPGCATISRLERNSSGSRDCARSGQLDEYRCEAPRKCLQ